MTRSADAPASETATRRTRLSDAVPPAAALTALAEELVTGAAGPVVGLSLHLAAAPGTGATVRAEARLLRRAGDLQVWSCRMTSASGVLLAEATLTAACGVDVPAGPAPTPDTAVPRKVPVGEPAETATGGLDPRQAQIARAACTVIAEKGYAAASVREIAEAAGMHVPTVYSHVKGKSEILELVYAWTIGRMLEQMEPVFAQGTTPPERLEAIMRRLTETNDLLWHETGVLNRETRSLSLEARDRVLSRYYDGMVVRIAGVIAEGIEQGHFRTVDPRLVANFIDALSDIWPLRPFAVGRAGRDGFAAELEAFVTAALRP